MGERVPGARGARVEKRRLRERGERRCAVRRGHAEASARAPVLSLRRARAPGSLGSLLSLSFHPSILTLSPIIHPSSPLPSPARRPTAWRPRLRPTSRLWRPKPRPGRVRS